MTCVVWIYESIGDPMNEHEVESIFKRLLTEAINHEVESIFDRLLTEAIDNALRSRLRV